MILIEASSSYSIPVLLLAGKSMVCDTVKWTKKQKQKQENNTTLITCS